MTHHSELLTIITILMIKHSNNWDMVSIFPVPRIKNVVLGSILCDWYYMYIVVSLSTTWIMQKIMIVWVIYVFGKTLIVQFCKASKSPTSCFKTVHQSYLSGVVSTLLWTINHVAARLTRSDLTIRRLVQYCIWVLLAATLAYITVVTDGFARHIKLQADRTHR